MDDIGAEPGFEAALAEAQLDQLQFTARHVSPGATAAWMRSTNDPEALGGAVRSLAWLHAWLGAVLRGLKD